MPRGKDTADRAVARRKQQKLSGRPKQVRQTDVELALQEMDQRYIMCRDQGHHWTKNRWGRTQHGNLARAMLCATCGTIKHERLRWDGSIYSRFYDHPQGYLIAGAKDRRHGLQIAQVRAEVIRREVLSPDELEDETNIVPIRRASRRKPA